jgi:hypothetical protein
MSKEKSCKHCEDIWVKIGLPGADPQLGTLQGRICDESITYRDSFDLDPVVGYTKSFEWALDDAIYHQKPIRLFDPIIFRAQRDQQGNVLLGALNLVESMPNIEGKYITLNPSNILWWAKLEETENWKNVVASTIHHIEITGSDVDFGSPQDPKGPGPRLVK